MKKLILIATLAMLCVNAHSQSRTVVYGILEDGVDFNSNVQGSHLVQLLSGVTAASKWGIRGTEDMGGGLTTIFQIAGTFDLNSGALFGNRIFSSNDFVGLRSNRLGTLTLGRQWDAVVDYIGPFTLNGNVGGAYLAHPNDIDNTDQGFHTSNAIKYSSPMIAGFTFEGLYAFGNTPGQFSQNASFSAGISYAFESFSAGIAYLRVNSPETATQGYQSGGGYTNAIYGSYLSAARAQNIFGVGASYKPFSMLTLLADFTNTTFQQGSAGHDATFQNYELSALVMPAPDITIGAGYTLTKGRDHATDASPTYDQYNLTAEYALSKRTSLYVIGAFQRARGDAPVAQIAVFNPSSNQKQAVGRVGIRSLF
ncbi:porin [Paraburkholderia nemoris]|uniref:porin n=1 Tax=Paraburkholderia nemoris TaxID=2793076 RepID=UPI0038BCCEE8